MSMRGSLHDQNGKRLYLTPIERLRFLSAASTRGTSERLLCQTLAHTGVRISEALSITDESLDFELSALTVESLKKRTRGIYRTIPLPLEFLVDLQRSVLTFTSSKISDRLLWPWCRTTAYYLIKDVMREAEIAGPQASPKGLRHGFAINALSCGVPLNMIQKWMGHSSIEITSLYLNAMGEEERTLAAKMWQDSSSSFEARQLVFPNLS